MTNTYSIYRHFRHPKILQPLFLCFYISEGKAYIFPYSIKYYVGIYNRDSVLLLRGANFIYKYS